MFLPKETPLLEMTRLSFDLDKLIRDLNELLESVGDSDADGKQITGRGKMMGLDVSTNVSIRVGLLESLNQPSGELSGNELLDVFDNDDNVKLVALIPGIEKEGIAANVRDGFIEVKIRKGNSTFCRNIPCNVKPDQIRVASMTCNNSVLEIIFKKGDANAYSR